MKMTAKDERPNGRTKLHNVRFYNLTPRSIDVMAHNKLLHKLALSRDDGSIEIWDIQHAPLLEKTIPRSPGNSVEALVWVGERFFSTGLSGELVEWNLKTLQPLRKQFVTGNAIWCIAANADGTELAIGTEEGYINIFNIAENEMQYKHLFDKQEGRVLCCKYDASGEYLVTGSVDAIRIWNVRSGHAIHKMTVSRAEKNKQVIVWSLQVLSDFTIISGDSRGYVTVWDGRLATQIESHQVLKADVLTVAINEEENLLVCSGIEPIIRIYAKTLIRKEDTTYYRWVKYLQRNVHDHDVKMVLCIGDDRILSGGVDGYLGMSSLSKAAKSSIAKFGPFLQHTCVVVATQEKLLLLRYKTYLEIWRLSKTNGKISGNFTADEDCDDKKTDFCTKSSPVANKSLDVIEGPEKLLELKSKRLAPIVCATISPDGQWIVYATDVEVRVFRFFSGGMESQRDARLLRVKDLPEQFAPATHMQFSSDSKRLFLVTTQQRRVQVFAIVTMNGSMCFDFVESIETTKHIKDTIQHFNISPCGTYIALCGTDRTIAIWSVHRGKHFKHHMNLPRYAAATSAIAIHPERPRLVATFADGKLFEYDFEEMAFTCTESKHFIASAVNYCVTNVLLDVRNPGIFILQNDSNFYVLEKCLTTVMTTTGRDDEHHISLKKSKRLVLHDDDDAKVSRLCLKMQKSFEHLIHLSWLSADELVGVSVNPISMLVQLPDAFKQNKFGTT